MTKRLGIPIREVLVGPPGSTWDQEVVNELEALVRSHHYDQALERGGELLDQVQAPAARALVHLRLGHALSRLRRLTEALEQLNLAEELFVSVGNQGLVAEVMELRALALYVAEQPEALTVAEQALDRYRALPHRRPEVESRLLERLGMILAERGDFVSARAHYEEALERAGGVRGVDIKAGVLRQARARAQLSLAQVGGNELTRQAVHLIETGKVRPSMRSLRGITDRLAIPIDAVLIGPRGSWGELDELIEEFAREDHDLSRVVDALPRARTMVRELAHAREQAGMTQAQVADRMGTTQSAVARLERAEVDPRLSTLVKYAAVVGRRVSIG